MLFRDRFRKRSRAIAHARAQMRCSRGNQKARRQTRPVVHLSEEGDMSTVSSVCGRAGIWVGVFAFALASGLVFLRLRKHPRFVFVLHALPLCGAGAALSAMVGWFASGFAGIRDVLSSFTRRPCAGRELLCLRRSVGLIRLLLASAICLRASSVAPVRGGTYFSLPPQRKVGKRKRLTPPTFLPA